MTINVFTPFSVAPNGKPITVTATTSPGTLIHQTTTESDSIWLWANVSDAFAYTKAVYIHLVKGTELGGYTNELIKLPSGRKFLIENGIIITGNIELRAYIDSTLTTVLPTPEVLFTGYVHRRI